MNKKIIAILFLLIMFFPVGFLLAEESVLNGTVTPFLKSLQTGKISSITRYVSGQLKQNMELAFKKNRDYGNFLRGRYDGATFTATTLQQGNKQEIVQVDVIYSGGQTSTFELLVQQDSDGRWHVTEQYLSGRRPHRR